MRYLSGTILGAIAVILTACSQPPVPNDNFYRLHVGSPKLVFNQHILPGTVEVRRFNADGLMANRNIAYANSEKPHLLNEYHYHFWSEPPPIMIRDQLVDYLRASKASRRVVTPDLRITTEFIISGKIKRFEHIRGNNAHAAVELELAAQKRNSGDLLYLGTYGVKTPITGNDVAAAVDSINRSVKEIFSRFLKHIASKK
ncbi:MAG: ABC-type transport auxiliary lipoprotein family protein [Rhodospirillaceae bacterium]